MVGSLRRTTSVSNSGGEESSSSRRRTATGDHDSSKPKHEPLPDIMHDWEIIVKSLRENESDHKDNIAATSENKFQKSTVKSSRSTKVEPTHTDSDKENARLRKKVLLEPAEKSADILSPSSSSVDKIKADQDIKQNKNNLEVSPHDDSEATWRRPTRSTYKAFENIFESPELDIPLECELNAKDKRELQAIKKILSPTKLNIKEKRPLVKRRGYKLKRLSKFRKLRNNKLILKSSSKILGKNRRGRPKKFLSNKLGKGRRILKGRYLTRGLTKNTRASSSYRTAEDSSDVDRAACRELYIKVENLKIPSDLEMDFIGFGSPVPSEKVKLTSPYAFNSSKEIIEEESLGNQNSKYSSFDEKDEVVIAPTALTSPVNDEKVKKRKSPNKIKFQSEFEKSPKKILSNNEHGSLKVQKTPKKKLFNSEFETVKMQKTPIKNLSLRVLDSLFVDDINPINDFKGFPSSVTNERTCLKCFLVLDSSDLLREHIKIAHKRIYNCPFNVGNCGYWKGSCDLHNHLISSHKSLISFLKFHLNSDLHSGKITSWTEWNEVCSVCLMQLNQPLLCIHEMIIHGIWPPSLLNLSSVAIDQHVSLWWTGRTQAFACHLCHSSQSKNGTIPIVRSAPHSFPTLLSNHLRNVHLLNLPLFQGWFLLIKLLLSLPVYSRRTLATTILLGVDSKLNYSQCVICHVPLGFYSNMNLYLSNGLCNRCEVLCRCDNQCWFYNCNFFLPHILSHMLTHHKSNLPAAWCVNCGEWFSNIFMHLNLECVEKYNFSCKFCNIKVHDMTLTKKVWHSLSSHVFPCPIPDCKSLLGVQETFPTAIALYTHLLVQHLPEWEEFSLDQVNSLILNSKNSHGVVLTTFSAQHLNGIWVGLSGHRYSLLNNVLTPIETTKVSISCILCYNYWEEAVDYHTNEKGAVCPECSILLTQCDNRALLNHCPIYRCLENINSNSSGLHDHLKRVHKISAENFTENCIHCGVFPVQSPLSPVIHDLLRHRIACLLCKYTAPLISQLRTHWETTHSLPSWEAVFQHLKLEELSRQKGKEKPKILHGVIRVWSEDQSAHSQWDPTLDLSELLTHDQENEVGIINQSLQEPEVSELNGQMQSMNDVDPWCSSLCTVSMSSPNKHVEMYGERDVKPDIFQMQNNFVESCMSPEMLIPTISVNENSGEESDANQGYSSDGSTDEPQLQIDSTVQSPNQLSPISRNSDNLVNKNFTPKRGRPSGIKSLSNKNETNKFRFINSLNSVMEETLHSMNEALSPPSNGHLKALPMNKNAKKLDNAKYLGDNAFIDEKVMAENILIDLEDKYSGTCIECGNSILLPHLNFHIKTIHPDKVIICSCGFQGELYSALVHMFHMSHIPSEARPIILGSETGENKIMIVLEARPDLKTITYPCYKCSKRFKQEKSRQLHYNLCKLEKKFSCDVCSEKFALENHLQKHKEWKHNPQICKHCSKTFNSSSSLAQHVLHIHKRPSQRCKQCGDVFNTSKQLKVHWRIHTGEQPHSCQFCSHNFISRNLLMKHMSKAHKQSLINEQKAKHYKLNGGTVSSSDSSDSENNDQALKLKRPHNNDNEIKVVALTESDLNTSSSDMETSPTVPTSNTLKKGKVSSRRSTTAVTNSKDSPAGKREKGQEFKSNKAAGIYQDREGVSLPEIRGGVKARVESIVGHVCIPCGQEFDSPTAKLLHMYLIHPEVVLSLGFSDCSFCDHAFSSADDVSNHHLDKHQRTFLSNGKFRCLCGLVFSEDGAYYFHLYYAHKAQRALNIGGEIVCRLCDGRPRLNKIVDLVVHLSDRHTMFDHVRFKDSYMCNFCYKAFESWTVLSLHFVMVHKATKSQTLSYDCPYCKGASPWHSLEALQYHLDNVHRGRHTQSKPVAEHSRSIYSPAPIAWSPTVKKENVTPVKPIQIKNLRAKKTQAKKYQKQTKKQNKVTPKLKLKKPQKEKEILYCICQSPYDEQSDMIGCDNSNCKFQWFHFQCVNILSAPEGNWYCPDCSRSSKQQKSKQNQTQGNGFYKYYSNFTKDVGAVSSYTVETVENRSRHHSASSISSNSSNSSSSSSSNSSSSSSSSGDSSSASGDEN